MQELVSESLNIVGEELAVTFSDIRSTLERYADGGASPQSMERCIKLLHSANGVLRMTETYGASLLTEEMEEACRYLEKTRRKDASSDEAMEALSRAAVQLPAYVELIINGSHDIPLILLPLLNDLRAACGRPLLSESTLLLINLTATDDEANDFDQIESSGEDIVGLCKELRPRFQLALLGWLKGDHGNENLEKIGQVVERIQRAAQTRNVRQLWWVVTGIVEALLEDGLESSLSLKRLMGQVDREMKRLPVIGENQYAEQPPTELINNLLYYVARASSKGDRISAVRAAFDLSELMPGSEQVESARENLGAPGKKLMKTVSEAIRDDLARVKDVLDIYVRTGMEHVEELVPQIELLKKIGDTLGVLGLGELREIIQTKRADLQAIIEAGENVEDTALIEMASALLSVEDRLEAGLFDLVRPAGNAAEENTASKDHDYEEVMQAVMRECVVNLARIKDAVAQILDRPEDGVQFDAVPIHLNGIIAGLTILEKEAAVSLVEQIGEQINSFVQADQNVVDTHQFDLLADAIVSLEYYMETVQAGRKEPFYMLDNARDCLVALRESDQQSVSKVANIDVSGMTATMQAPGYEPTVVASNEEIRPVLSSADGENVDPELLELFIEEAGEEIESIARNFSLWEQDDGNHEALITVRRSFHTLKGSGRVVGAELIGEYCWSIEDLLNRLINRTLEPQAAINDFLHRAFDALPELLEQLEVGEEPQADIDALMHEATDFLQPAHMPQPTDEEEAVSVDAESELGSTADDSVMEHEAGEELAGEDTAEEVVANEFAEAVIHEADDVVPAVTEDEVGMDAVLLEILSKETGTHLEVISAFIAECHDSVAPFGVTEELYRACHTLHGSVTMANAAAAADITQPLNSAIRRAYDHDLPIEASVVSALADAATAMIQVIDYLSGNLTELPDTGELQARLYALDEELEALVAEAETRAEQSLQPVVEADLMAASSDAAVPVFDKEIAEIFSEEAAEILEMADATLEQKAGGKLSESILAELQRNLHTLKGGARMAGLMAFGDFSHEIETLLVRMDSGELEQSAERLDLLRVSIDELHRLRDQIEQGVCAEPAADIYRNLQSMLGIVADEPAAETEEELVSTEDVCAPADTVVNGVDADQAAEIGSEPEPESEPESESEETAAMVAEESDQTSSTDQLPAIPVNDHLGQLARELDEPAKPGAGDLAALIPGGQQEPAIKERRELARVDPALLENLLNAAGEVSIFHSRLSQQLGQIQFNLEELSQTVIRQREQLRNLEMATEAQIIYQHQSEVSSDEPFDPLSLERYSKIQQLSRALGETTSDVASIKDLLHNLTGDTEALLVQQARTAAELQDGLMRTRMVPFEQHTSRLSRLVRQMSTEHGKQAELTVQGSGEIDRQVLEKMVPALEHMIRNAVIHGIETPAERLAAGKSEVGQISINLRREGSQIVMEIADDGLGMDIDSIRQKAANLGLITEDTELTSEEIIQFVLRSGFSTADQLTHAAGRGVGMDVVANEVAKLGGMLQIETEAGSGTKIIVYLPYTLAITQALIVRAGAELYAIPLQTVEGIIRITRSQFDEKLAAENPVIEYGGQNYQLQHLGHYLGLSSAIISEDQDRVSIFLVQAGENSTALVTDEMLDSREIVVKPVGGQLASIRGISGATILGDGQIVVILDVGALVRTAPKPIEAWESAVEPEPEEPLALVVDDSITMRRVTQRLLERNNIRVITAKDGVEAVGVLRDHHPDIILLDVEMPRMDGYEFATFVRNNSDTEDVPIIMITSRVSENHKARAIELGVNDYLGKPYQEKALLEAVHQLLDVELV
jgi:chemosensory pili system protein ChpA (sensor histidine kinase/response regulator)